MPATRALIDLMGEAALLLWGVHMVRTGVLRAAGGDLRRLLGRALANRFAACLAGALVTLALQSSTATAMLTTSFVTEGAIGPVPALAVMLGANLGSALNPLLAALAGCVLALPLLPWIAQTLAR